MVIDLIEKRNFDGMILLMEHVANTMTDAEIRRLFRNISGLPIISIGRSSKALTSVLIDNKRSMRNLVSHLLKDHGYRRIAFINGPRTSIDGRQRFDAYKETLLESGTAIDERLIVNDGDFYASGTDAVKILLDERRIDFDAIVAANDAMAIFAIKELERRGIRVPADVAVTGFDDIEAVRQRNPGLTTIRQSLVDIGRESVKAMRAVLTGENVQPRIVLPTQLIIRESCGCTDVDKLDRILSCGGRVRDQKKRRVRRGPADGAERLVEIIEQQAPSLLEKSGVRTAVESLARGLPAVGNDGERRKFLKRIGDLFGRFFEMKTDMEAVYRFTVSFFSAAADGCGDPARRELFRALQNESLIVAGLSAEAHRSSHEVNLKTIEESKLIINDDFLNLINLSRLKEIISMQLLPWLPFKRFYVCLYTDSSRRTARLLMQYHSGSVVHPATDKSPFPAKELVPGVMQKNSVFEYFVVALFFAETNFGYIVFDVTNRVVDPIYHSLAAQISASINSAMQTKAIQEFAGHLEEKVKERTRQLESANRERTNFFNNIAHEIKNPLTLIHNYLDAYIAKVGLSDELQALKSNFEALVEVMDHYLSREKIESGRIVYRHNQIADFSDIVRNDVILFTESARRKRLRFYDEIAPDIFVAADPEALEGVVGNLLQNAVRFTKKGGSIKVSLGRRGDKVEFSVKDTGVGLSTEQIEHIFERYYQVNGAGEGAAGFGIGLDIVKKILDELGAEIRVTSVKGRGTTFICGFTPARTTTPVRTHFKRTVQPTVHEADDARRGVRSNLLYVEDNAELLSYFVDHTKDIFNVYCAVNGFDALEKLKHIPKPNIIVSDILMDKMDGFRLFDEMMKNEYYRDIPFIFLTGINTRMDRLKALNQGAVDFITKPFLMDELIAKIRSNLKIREALKKKTILFLGSKVYRAIEAEVNKHEDEIFKHNSDDIDRLYVRYGISKKEIEIISLLRLGLPHKQIAARLNISMNTMRTHMTRIHKKCNVNSTLELFAKLKV
ncbi:MAG: substrate-binding domain-containing protein [Spirochaetales bacterium]|nr:substrate-binding domain-containing protein [Spirochaetales bacterium]